MVALSLSHRVFKSFKTLTGGSEFGAYQINIINIHSVMNIKHKSSTTVERVGHNHEEIPVITYILISCLKW